MNLFPLCLKIGTYILLTPALFSQQQEQKTQEREPQQSYLLRINDQEYQLQAGEELQLEGVFENPTINIEPTGILKFDQAGVRFDYPSYYAFEEDKSEPGITIWTLDGKNAVIMIYEVATADFHVDLLAESLLDLFGESASSEPIKREIADQTLEGIRISLNIANHITR